MPSTENRSGLTNTQQRGEYLVNNLEHCGTCHTPRNLTQGLDKDRYLSGAPLGKWFAPNITPDNDTGIGLWSEMDIVTYLRTGTLDKRAYAGGPMAEAVAHSIRYLTDEDLIAMASYLKVVPAIKTDDYLIPVNVSRLPQPVSDSITYDLLEQKTIWRRQKPRRLAVPTIAV
ncbi:c-type cytochrome [Psychrobacter sp. ER1]|uniref:c-type cytochrome n=1 Tax=Psychrobacter sp. ER1 TaxID=3406645 RepID=UPI003B439FAF